MTDREAMQMALETAEQIASADYRHWEELASLGEFERWARSRANHIAEALRTALAQPDVPETAFGKTEPEPEPEPVAWISHNAGLYHGKPDESLNPLPLYLAPPQRKWQGLTDKQYEAMAEQYVTNCYFDTLEYAKNIESKLKDKNNG